MGIIRCIDDVVIRPARREDACDELLYLSAAPYYDVYAGSQERARRILRALWPRERHNASYEVCRVAERDGQLLGVAAGFPIEQGERLANRFVVLSFPRIPIWRWPTVLAHLRAAGRVAPSHPLRVWYVDALAVAPEARRAGVARALLDDAVAQARAVGLAGVALDTALNNGSARKLYESSGFDRRDVRHAPDPRSERAIGGPGFVSYLRPVTRHRDRAAG